MNWAIELIGRDGRDLGTMYCTSRDEARQRARFYRTMTGEPNPVLSTRIRKVGA